MFEQEYLVKRVEVPEAVIGLREDGIIHVSFVSGTEITVEVQMKLLEVYNNIASFQKRKFVFEGGEFVSISKDAMDNAFKIEDEAPLGITAVVIRNLAQKLIAEFYYKVRKPKQPYKVFKEFDKAIAWLHEQVL
jgi:hypothetical protein